MSLLFGLLAAVGSQNIPKFGTGNELLATCESEDVDDVYACYGYLNGFLDGTFASDNQSKMKSRVCLPAGVTNKQIKDVLLAGLRSKPQARHLPAMLLATVIFEDAFPCRS